MTLLLRTRLGHSPRIWGNPTYLISQSCLRNTPLKRRSRPTLKMGKQLSMISHHSLQKRKQLSLACSITKYASVLSRVCRREPPEAVCNPANLVDHHLPEVLHEMHEKYKIRRWADWKDQNYKGAVAEFSWLPGYIIKFDDGRIKGGELLKKAVRELRLNLISIPEQTPYNIPNDYHSITHLRTLCISKKIEGLQGLDKKISAKQAEQLTALVKATGIADLKWRNLVHCPDGKIALIDTESFWGERIGLASLRDLNSFE